jgi:hypothetical protein
MFERTPVCCVKCQEYRHIQEACIGVEKCANCTSEFHSTNNCDRTPKCVSCRDSSTHPSTSPSCPTFIHKCEALDECYPENAMLYFPTNKKWTWASSPTNLPLPTSSLPPPQQPNPRQHPIRPIRQASHHNGTWNQPPQQPHHPQPQSQPHQSDNGWPTNRRQSTLLGVWGSQPVASSSSNPRADQSLLPSTQ